MIYKKKHQVNGIAELLDIQNNLEILVSRSLSLDNEINEAQKEVNIQLEKVRLLGNSLSEKRKQSFRPLKEKLEKLLAEVGMPDASVAFESQTINFDASGMDEIQIMFSANKGIAPQAISKVASGGEFSRLMFCIKYILAEKIALPTVIFDEIDTGISGEIALKMGNLMKKMAVNHQLITISHLPQIAAKGDAHYFVYKDNSAEKTISKIKQLSEEERVEEIAKMLGGEHPTPTAYQNAKELMNTN